ncbi:MAG: glycosyltransferase family 2 protein [Lachnospiraceae bacterium]|nr:glycosyltransferase family 2 protein [Lachnospiraceae bacterium]
MYISVVIPVYGCRSALPELHKRLTDTLVQISKDYEIILVNDNCPENSWEVIEELCKNDNHVVGIELSRNFGQMKAIQAGLDYSTGEWNVVMDCDLQDRPEEILTLYNKAMEGYDVVFARRAERKDGAVKKFLSNRFYSVYRAATGVDYDGAICNFSIAKRNVIESYCSLREEHRDYSMYMFWLGFKRAIVDVEHNERYEGKSGYSLRKRIKLATSILTSQSDAILRFFVGLGFVMSVVAFVVLICLVVNYFVSSVDPGWTSIIATTVLVGGLIVMVIGVVGIYVGNTFMQSKNRPLYIIRQVVSGEGDDADMKTEEIHN